MTVQAITKTAARTTALHTLANENGLSPHTSLSAEIQELFGLESSDPFPFVNRLRFLRDTTKDVEALEAANCALGLEGAGYDDATKRRIDLLTKRHGEGWNVTDVGCATIDEIRGYGIIAELYDLTTELMNQVQTRRQISVYVIRESVDSTLSIAI